MKIGGTRQIGQTTGKRPASARGVSSGFTTEGAGEGREVGVTGLGATASLGAVDALLALQEASFAGDALTSPKRAIARGEQMLDMLDDIKVALLSGQVPKAKLTRLLAAVEGQKSRVTDPELANILDHIELRARVELAKFGSFTKE